MKTSGKISVTSVVPLNLFSMLECLHFFPVYFGAQCCINTVPRRCCLASQSFVLPLVHLEGMFLHLCSLQEHRQARAGTLLPLGPAAAGSVLVCLAL